jgi:cholesterol transport system auxiliary component
VRMFAALLLATLACTGCAGSLLESRNEAPEVYRLVGPALADGGQRLPLVLGIAPLRAAASLDTARIAVVEPDSRFDSFAGMRWSDAAPEMLGQLIVRSVAADGRFATVVATPSRVPADLLLDVELRRFEAVYVTGIEVPRVIVEMQVTLIDNRRARSLVSFVQSASATAAANGQVAVLAAFEQATAEALVSITTRIRESADGAAR